MIFSFLGKRKKTTLQPCVLDGATESWNIVSFYLAENCLKNKDKYGN